MLMTFPTTIRVGAGSATIECPDLGYTCVMKTQADAERELLNLITTHDPMLAAVPPEKRKATFDRTTGVLAIESSEEMRAALAARTERLGKGRHASA